MNSSSSVISTALRSYPITIILIVVNVAIFLIGLAPKLQLEERMALNTTLVLQTHQWYRLFSSMFLHFGWWHIIMNMWALWDIGTLIEPRLAEWKFALLYLGSGLCGSLLVMLSDTLLHHNGLTAGASGAIFGLFGVLLAMAVKHVMPGMNAKMIIANIVLMLLPGFFTSGISLAGHLGGLIGGFLLGLLLV